MRFGGYCHFLQIHGHSLESDPYSVFNCLSVCLSVCSDDNDTKCSKLLRASLRGTSGSYRSLLQVYYTTYTPNVEIHMRVAGHIGKYDTMLEIVMKRKLRWFGHVVSVKGILANTNLYKIK